MICESLVKVKRINCDTSGLTGITVLRGIEVDKNANKIAADQTIAVRIDNTISDTPIRIGETWRVKGKYKYYTGIAKNGYQYTQKQLVAIEASLYQNAGDNFIEAISDNPAFTGIGPERSRKLWARFGEGIYSLIENEDIEALTSTGIMPESCAQNLVDKWVEYGFSDSLVWLDRIGIPSDIGKRVYAFYLGDTKSKIEEDPYRMTAFTKSWEKIDAIIRRIFDIEDDDHRRLMSAIEEALYRAVEDGHTAQTSNSLKSRLVSIFMSTLDTSTYSNKVAARSLSQTLTEKALSLGTSNGGYYKSADYHHPAAAYLMEQMVVERITLMIKDRTRVALSKAISTIIDDYRIQHDDVSCPLTDEQKSAVWRSLQEPISILIGGAGVGKTTVLDVLYQCLQELNYNIVQVALTGRAAKRMKDCTGFEASTIARYVKQVRLSGPDKLGKITCLVVDEASMVSIKDIYEILIRLPHDAKLIIVGDHVQLPPISAGLFLRPLALSPFTENIKSILTVVKRSSDDTGIPVVANKIRNHV